MTSIAGDRICNSYRRKIEVRVSRIHGIAQEMFLKIHRTIVLPRYGAFRPGKMFLKVLVKMIIQQPIFLLKA